MAARKKTKTKAKKAKKKAAPAKARKTSARKPAAKKKVVARKQVNAKAKSVAKAKVAAKPAAAPQPSAPPAGERIGIVTHYYTHLAVAIIQLESGSLRTGDVVHIKGHTSDFTQRVDSMEVEHMHVDEVRAGQSFGLRVKEHAREHDVVYKVGP